MVFILPVCRFLILKRREAFAACITLLEALKYYASDQVVPYFMYSLLIDEIRNE